LYSNDYINDYEKLIARLLHGITNLEKLDLSLVVLVTKAFIDGNDLKQNIIYYIVLITFNKKI
jgi:hypothetical protein